MGLKIGNELANIFFTARKQFRHFQAAFSEQLLRYKSLLFSRRKLCIAIGNILDKRRGILVIRKIFAAKNGVEHLQGCLVTGTGLAKIDIKLFQCGVHFFSGHSRMLRRRCKRLVILDRKTNHPGCLCNLVTSCGKLLSHRKAFGKSILDGCTQRLDSSSERLHTGKRKSLFHLCLQPAHSLANAVNSANGTRHGMFINAKAQFC